MEEHVEDQLAAYALGTLEPEEALQVSNHLRHCSQCRDELQAYDEVVQVLPLAAPAHEPPAGLKRAILDGLDAVERHSPAPAPPGRRRGIAAVWARFPAWGVLSLLLVLVLGAANLALWSRLQDQTRRPETGLQTVNLLATDLYPEATGIMVVGGDGRVGSLIVDRLPPPGEGRQYQLWLIRGEERDSGGLFKVDDEGYGVLYMHTDRPLLSYTGFGITDEPEGGSPGPTGEKVLGVDF